MDKALQILQECSKLDEYGIYSEHIAMKLRNYGKHTQSMVQHLFNNIILFNTDMGQYDN